MSTSSNPVIIVTGSSSGIGAEVARLAARNGWNVVVNYNSNQAGADAVVEYCQEQGVEAVAVGADVGEDLACRELAATAEESWGRIDCLVNNAGTTKFCPGMVAGEWLQEGLGDEMYAMVQQHYENQASTGEIMTAETVAQNIWYFVAGAPNVTGEQLILDGGATLPY